jgi:hypothetical protein
MTAGTKLGGYEILAPIGAGGMGDPERMARFRRKAEVLASLNHPNIAAICGGRRAGSGDGTGRGRISQGADAQ